MRLRDLRDNIEKNIANFKLNTIRVNSGTFRIDIFNCKKFLEKLSNYGFLAEEMLRLNNYFYIIINSTKQEVEIDESVYYDFKSLIDLIGAKCKAVIFAIDEALPEQNEFSISVKLPPIKNLSELQEFIHILDIALSNAIVRDDLQGRVELQNLDTGSNWIEILVGSSMAFSFVGKMIWAALDVTKKMHDIEISRRALSYLEIANDAMKSVEVALASASKSFCQQHADELIQQGDIINSDNEYYNRLSASIEMLTKLMLKGAEIYQARISQTQYKDAFPDVTDFKLLHSVAKQITGSSETDNK